MLGYMSSARLNRPLSVGPSVGPQRTHTHTGTRTRARHARTHTRSPVCPTPYLHQLLSDIHVTLLAHVHQAGPGCGYQCP